MGRNPRLDITEKTVPLVAYQAGERRIVGTAIVRDGIIHGVITDQATRERLHPKNDLWSLTIDIEQAYPGGG